MNSRIVLLLTLLIVSCGHGKRVAAKSNAIEDSNKNIEQKIMQIVRSIDSVTAKNQGKDSVLNTEAQVIENRMKWLCKYYDRWEERLIEGSGGMDSEGDIVNPADIDITTQLLVTEKGGDTLQYYIAETRLILLDQMPGADSLKQLLPIGKNTYPLDRNNDYSTRNQSNDKYKHLPVVAAIALFDQYKNDALSSELKVLNIVLEEVNHN